VRPVVVDSLGLLKMRPGEIPPLPADDRNIVVTFHYYSPYRFTHQGATFSKIRDVHGVTWGDSADRQTLHEDFDRFARLAAAAQRPMLLGEFGAYDKSGTPVELRAAWVGAVACEAERHNFSWSYWQFRGDFALWDQAADAWVQPIKEALLPPRGANSIDRRC
jgi:endoglucanase